MSAYGWVDLNLPEHREYLVDEAERLSKKVDELCEYVREGEQQKQYIVQLEKQVSLLQKTVDIMFRNQEIEEKLKQRSDDLSQNEECLRKQS
jgi:heme oxygenase